MKRFKDKPNYHGYTKQEFLMHCSKNAIFQIPFEQDELLLTFGKEISSALIAYLVSTTKDNLEKIYQNEFEFKLNYDEPNGVFHIKFEYIH